MIAGPTIARHEEKGIDARGQISLNVSGIPRIRFFPTFPHSLNHERTRKHATRLDAQDRRRPAEERNRAHHPAWPPRCGRHPATRVHITHFTSHGRNPSVPEHHFRGANDGQKGHGADSTALCATATACPQVEHNSGEAACAADVAAFEEDHFRCSGGFITATDGTSAFRFDATSCPADCSTYSAETTRRTNGTTPRRSAHGRTAGSHPPPQSKSSSPGPTY